MDIWRVANAGGCWVRSSSQFSDNVIGTLLVAAPVTVVGPVENDFYPVKMWVHKSMLVPQSDIPYISQWSMTANITTADCGETCCLMLAQSLGVAKDKTVDDCVRLINNYKGWTTPGQLVELLGKLGTPGQAAPDLQDATICLIDYSKVRPELKQDKNFAGLHWVLCVKVKDGTVTYHDPDFWGNDTWKGANKTVSEVDFRSWCTNFYVVAK